MAVGIISAIPEEYSKLEWDSEPRTETIINKIFQFGSINGVEVVAAECGIGKVNAAMTTALLLGHFSCSSIAFSGVAGGINPKFKIGDVIIAEQLIQDQSKSGIYHYSGQPNVSWCQFANAIFEQMDCKTRANPIPTTEYPTPALRPLNSRLDCEAIQKTFGITRPFWRDGLEEILRDLEGEDDRA